MNNETFNDLMEHRFDKIRKVLAKKAKEYARGDRLSNFKRAAGAMACTPQQALVGMMMKHIISIVDCVNDASRGEIVTMEMWNEKIGDAINYLILLEGLVEDGIGGVSVYDK